jgi:TetR/AcrR family transcriptional regulator, transcriptional repressor for nem operon
VETVTRPLTRKGQATRDRIVAAAAGLMFERGVAGTTTEDVQRAAGVSPSQIYHYFGDKRSLVAAVIDYQAEQILGVQRPLLSALDSVEALEGWRDAIVAFQERRGCDGGCPLGSLVSELADEDEAARVQLVGGLDRWAGAIRDGLAGMRERGALAPGTDTDGLALALLTALQGGLLMTRARRDTVALAAVLDAVIDRVRACAVTPGGAVTPGE